MSSKNNMSSDAAGPSAFEIKLGISAGRSSPDSDPETIMVNAETTVNWIFVQGAYVLSHIHSRDRDGLQKDFDLYLVRPGRDDIVLNQSRVIADYNITRNDVLQFRHKSLPIPICVNLCEGDDRKVEVNSGFPLMDIIPVICKKLGVVNYKELSIALPSSAPGGSTMHYEWLDRLSSLNGQGVQQGDTLLLRKKFFILNDDIQEALDGNDVLMELIYQQVREMFTKENFVGTGGDCISSCSKLSALFHHIEQADENISDENSMHRVMPKQFEKNTDYYSQTVSNYYGERIGTLNVAVAKQILLKYFCGPQSIILNYFPVQKSADQQEGLVFSVDSDRIKVSRKLSTDEQLQVVDGMNWRLRDLRDCDCTSQKDRHLRVNILGSWHEFVTDHRIQISRYLMEAQSLTKLRVAKGRVSAINMQGLDIVGEILNRQQVSSSSQLGATILEEAELSSPLSQKSPLKEQNSPLSLKSALDSPLSQKSPLREQKSPLPIEPVVVVVRSSQSEDDEGITVVAVDEVKQQEERARDESEPVTEATKAESGEFDIDDINEAMEKMSDTSTTNSGSSLAATPNKSCSTPKFVVPPPPPSLATTPHHTTSSKELEALGMEASPAKSLSASSAFFHIPEFLGLDFREVLENYRLFHVVIMKRDVRVLLLHINKPVQEIVDTLCATFDIPNPSSCYLWIPTGIQNIIEKYGGKPKNRAGKFKKNQNGRDFSPRLDISKTLKQQYNFTIKPFLLHLRHYQAGEGVDAVEEVDYGTEWPRHEHPDVARYRKFYQSWTGIVQGAYPIEKQGAIRLAGLLTQVYYGDWENNPPRDYDAKAFLAEKHQSSFGIASEVERVHRELAHKKPKECINEVVQACDQLPTMTGVFFEVAVPVKSDIFSVIPWNKMEQKWFGINHNGIFCMDKNSGELVFTRKLSDISKWWASENSFKLTFSDSVFNAYTYQTNEILDLLELFVQMTLRGRREVEVVEPEKTSRPPSEAFLTPTGCFNGDVSPKKTDLSLEIGHEDIISPAAYSL